MKAVLVPSLLACLLSCSPSDPEAAAPQNPPEAPVQGDPWVDAIQVWKLGERYLEPPGEALSIPFDRNKGEFSGLAGADARWFLKDPYLKSAVHFGCARTPHPYEDSLEAELRRDPGVLQLQALVLLMRVYAPASVDLQWKALQRLKSLPEKPGLRALLSELEGRFSEAVLDAALETAPPEYRYGNDPFLSWHVRAAGVVRARSTLPKLVKLSRSSHLDVSLAAERSLEDFDGEEGDKALAQCLLGWQYDAYIRAGRALLSRNKALLIRTLQATVAPEKCRYWQGILLAKADDPFAVPILCESVSKVGIIDREMFDHIERLAREQDLPLIRQLPRLVRPEQQERARQVEAELVRRFGDR